MDCSRCNKPNAIYGGCGNICGAIYCSEECADNDWYKNNHGKSCTEAFNFPIGDVADLKAMCGVVPLSDNELEPIGAARKRKQKQRLLQFQRTPPATPATPTQGNDPDTIRWRRLHYGVVLRLYHQTTPQVAAEIVRTQEFRIGSKGYAGAGIYFALSPQETQRKALSKGTMLQADVSVGHIFNLKGPNHNFDGQTLRNANVDAVITRLASGVEVIVYFPDQIRNIVIWKPGMYVQQQPAWLINIQNKLLEDVY